MSKTFKYILLGLISLSVLYIIFAINSSPSKQSRSSINQISQIPIISPSSQIPTETEIVFNIPLLIRKNISEVKAVLGKPINEYNVSGIITATYQKDEYELQIDYLSSTGDVAEIFLAKNSNSKDELLRSGNLDENSFVYSVKLQPSLRPDIAKYTGVHIYRWR